MGHYNRPTGKLTGGAILRTLENFLNLYPAAEREVAAARAEVERGARISVFAKPDPIITLGEQARQYRTLSL